jgi:enoyl-CoA hydratase/carnithine racemase
MKYETVLYEVKDMIAKIVMNRPEKMNAINSALWRDLGAVFKEAENDPSVRVIILTGSGRAFSSGWDLSDSPYTTVPAGYAEWGTGNALKAIRDISSQYLDILNVRKPTIAMVFGYCLAAGCYLEMLCDITVASDDATFGHPATGGGGVDSMPLWVYYLGAKRAKELLMTRRFINGKEAERIGLVNRSVPREKLEEEVWSMAKDIAAVPTDDDTPGGHGMSLLKENINTDMEILGLGALFSYHRHLNAWGHAGLGKGDAFKRMKR